MQTNTNAEQLYVDNEHLAKITLHKIYANPWKIAKKQKLEYEDLLQFCKEGLWNASIKYQENKGIKFKNFAISHIRWNLITRLKRECNLIKINSNEKYDWQNMYRVISMDTPLTRFDQEVNLHEFIPSESNVELKAVGNLIEESIYNHMNAQQVEIIKLRSQGLSYEKIGQLYGCTGANIKAKIYSLKNRLGYLKKII